MAAAETYRAFADFEVRNYSPTYDALASRIAADRDMLELIERLPVAKQQPNLLFAAVRFLGGPVENFALFKAWTCTHWTDVSATMRIRTTQTNEPGRCATLLPALGLLPGPLALLELGASAGLCLYPDRYQYRYGSVSVGDPASPVLLNCAVTGRVPIPAAVPQVIWRGGIDLNPLDVANDNDLRWLQSLVWPGQPERLQRLEAAARIVQQERPNLVRGDLNIELESLAAKVPPEATLVIFHSAVLTYLPPEARQTFLHRVRHLRGHWISNEAPAVLPELAKQLLTPPPDAPRRFLMALDSTPLAWTAPHGDSIQWLVD